MAGAALAQILLDVGRVATQQAGDSRVVDAALADQLVKRRAGIFHGLCSCDSQDMILALGNILNKNKKVTLAAQMHLKRFGL
jgi:hypothetical protein